MRSAARNFAPSRAKSPAVALPLPQPGPLEPAPETKATLFLSHSSMSRAWTSFLRAVQSHVHSASPGRRRCAKPLGSTTISGGGPMVRIRFPPAKSQCQQSTFLRLQGRPRQRAGRRRLGEAGGQLDEHQRPDDHDRREGRGNDQSQRAREAGGLTTADCCMQCGVSQHSPDPASAHHGPDSPPIESPSPVPPGSPSAASSRP